jgi:hypothetical protein
MANNAPTSYDWDTSDLPSDRRELLNEGVAFHEIVDRIVGEAVVTCCWPKPFITAPAEALGAKQICYHVNIRPETFDLFFNSAHGLRAMYWRSPAIGDGATRDTVQTLRPMLLQFATEHPEALASSEVEIDVTGVRRSLEGGSAKIWVRETDHRGNTMISVDGQPQLYVPRWAANENESGSKGRLW